MQGLRSRLPFPLGFLRPLNKLGRFYATTSQAPNGLEAQASTPSNHTSLSVIASALPKATQKLRFTTINPESNDNIYPEPLRLKGPSPSAVQITNPWNPEWPATVWSCQYFSIKATPPKRAMTSGRSQNKASPFPSTIPPKTRRDYGDPALAFDHIVLLDPQISPSDKAILRAEAKRHKSYSMALTIIVGKKKIHKLATVRAQIRKRVRAAIRLFVQAGISPSLEGSVQCGKVTGPAHHLLPGHYYTMQTSLDLYRMPMEELLPLISEGLTKIYTLGQLHLVDDKFKEESKSEQAEHDRRSSSDKAEDGGPDPLHLKTGPSADV